MSNEKQPEIRAISQGKKFQFPKHHISRKKLIKTVSIIVALILLSSSAYVFYYNSRKKAEVNNEKSSFDTMLKQANAAEVKGNIFGVKNIVSKYLEKPPKTNDYLYEADVRLAQACYSLNDFQCADNYGRRAVDVNGSRKNAGLYEMLGDINQQLKKDKDAIAFYKRALEDMEGQKGPSTFARRDSIKINIAYLEGGRK